MTRLVLALAAAGALASLSGCGRFKADGYHHPNFPLVVRYSEPQRYGFVSDDWRVENFADGNGGKPGSEKTGPDYTVIRNVDLDGDGDPDRSEGRVYDLKLVHRRTGAAMWVRTIPLPKDRIERDLKVFVNEYAEAISGTGFFAEDIAGGKVAVGARAYAAKVVSSAPTRLGRFEAQDAVLELASLEQLKLDPAARSSKLRVVFARTDYTQHVDLGGPKSVEAPALLMVGCMAPPDEFEKTSADFTKFLSAIDVNAAQ